MMCEIWEEEDCFGLDIQVAVRSKQEEMTFAVGKKEEELFL